MTELGVEGPVRFAMIGSGWRSEYYLRLSKDLPDRFRVGLYSPSDRRVTVAERFDVPPVDSVEAAARRGDAEFAIVAVPWHAAPVITIKLVELGVPVLVETPPAPDVEGMRALWSRIGHLDRVHVADQSMYMPTHQSRLAMIREGLIGEPTSVQVSSNHLYHAVSIIRGLLGAGKGATQVRAHDFSSPLLEPVSWGGFTHELVPQERVTTIATIDFGSGRSGLYDFTANQWFNPLRQRRLTRPRHGRRDRRQPSHPHGRRDDGFWSQRSLVGSWAST